MSQKLPTAGRPAMSFGQSLLWLAVIMVGAFPLIAAIGFRRAGATGVIAVAVAGGICWLGASAALASAALMQKSSPLGGVFLGMIFRMGLPLVAGLLVQNLVPALAQAGVFGFVLLYYFLALAVETFLALRMLPRNVKLMKTS